MSPGIPLAAHFKLDIGSLAVRVNLPSATGTTVLLGPNGAGKTTILQAILGTLTPKEGSITLGENALFSAQERINLTLQDRRLGYVPQKYALFPHLSVADNIAFGLASLPPSERTQRVHALLEDFAIHHLAKRKPAALSVGESQRVALARALAIEPRALLLDEPTSALDTTARQRVRTVLRERLRGLHIPTLIATHDLEDALVLSDRIAVIEAGQITQLGPASELQKQPATDFIRDFFRAPAPPHSPLRPPPAKP